MKEGILLVVLLVCQLCLAQNVTSNPSTGAPKPSHGLDIKQICKDSSIPLDMCTCEKLPGLCGTLPPQNETVTVPDGATVEEVCKLLNIKNCTCNNPLVSQYCGESKKTVYIIRCKPDAERLRAILAIVSSFVGLIGNGFVMIVTMVNWERSTKCHKLIGGLAIADFVFSIIQIIDVSPYLRAENVCDWIYGNVGCKFMASVNALSSLIGVGFIVIITLERFIGIIYPFSRGLSSKKINIAIFINIIISIGIVIPISIVSEYNSIPKRCFENWSKESSRFYSWFTLIFSFILPMFCLIFMYGKIIYRLHTTKTTDIDDFHQKQRQKENKRIIVILLLVLITYFVLVLPNRLVWILIDENLINQNTALSTFHHWKLYASLPIVMHVAVNPLIYSIVDRKFRSCLKHIFCGKRVIEWNSLFRMTRKNTVSISLQTISSKL
uniref:G-protein coupled receptors family 1 profile domain-containing protein n=1 Tax=Clytia hemisphaerica TaxID=252671 RepID=A0A7M5WT26_9CNID